MGKLCKQLAQFTGAWKLPHTKQKFEITTYEIKLPHTKLKKLYKVNAENLIFL